MSSVFKLKPGKGSPYYVEYTDENGLRKRIRGCSDKGVTEQIARKLESDVELRRRGVIDRRVDARIVQAARPIVEHLDEFQAALIAKGSSGKHAGMTLERATRIVALVTGAEIRSINPPRSIRDAERGPFMARVR